MMRFAAQGVVSFSAAPLRAALTLGFLVSLIGFGVAVFAVVAKVTGIFTVPGWTSVVLVTTLIGGVQLLVLGVIGLYIADIHAEVKRRPLYVVDRLTGFEEAIKAQAESRGAAAPPRARDRRFY